LSRFYSFIRRFPFTLIMLAGLVMAALLTNTYFEKITEYWIERIGFAPNDLWYWRLERLFTSALVTSGKEVFWQALFFVTLFVGLAEWMCGWKRTAATFWGVHLLSLVLLSVIVSICAKHFPGAGLDAVTLARDVGPSAGYFACLGLVSARLKPPWHWVSGGVLLLVFANILLLPPGVGVDAELKFSADLAHLLTFPLGWLSSWIQLPPFFNKADPQMDKGRI
jgi:hypothetical protein